MSGNELEEANAAVEILETRIRDARRTLDSVSGFITYSKPVTALEYRFLLESIKHAVESVYEGLGHEY